MAAVSMPEDGLPSDFALTLHAADPENDSLTWSISDPANNGTASASGAGSSKVIDYAPAANFNGSDSFTVQVSDGSLTDSILVNVTVEPVNDDPVITQGDAKSVSMSEDRSPEDFSLTLTASDVDLDTALTWSISTPAGHGTASASGSGFSIAIGYVPQDNYNGADRFVVRVADGAGGVDTIAINVTITPENDAPVCAAVALDTTRNMAGEAAPACTDVDSGQTLTYIIADQGAHGTASVAGSMLHFVPATGYAGSDLFTYMANDGYLNSNAAPVNVTVSLGNVAPVISEGSLIAVDMSEDNAPDPFSLTLHASDENTDDTLTWSITAQAAHGTASAGGVGLSKAIGYTPESNYNGTDQFTVSVSDGNGGSASIVVNVTIASVNDLPVIGEGSAVSVEMSEDEEPTAFTLLLHASDEDTDAVLNWSVSAEANHGTASASGTGTSKAIDYSPDANFNGSDSFVVRVADGAGGTDTITVSVNVSAINDAPEITEGSSANVTMSEDASPAAFELTLHATDVDEDALNWSISTTAAHGTAVASGPGSTKAIEYTPEADFNGSDSFAVQVSDGTLAAIITVNVTVSPVNDAPVISEGSSSSSTISEDELFTLLLHADDVDAGTLTWSILSEPEHGQAATAGTGNTKVISYQPDQDYWGTDHFVVGVSDGDLTDTYDVDIIIQAENDAPVCQAMNSVVTKNTPVDLQPDCTDVDGDPVTILVVDFGLTWFGLGAE